MQGRVGIDGSSVIMLFGEGRSPRTRSLTARYFGPANDNGPKDPVKTVTVRKTLEKSGVAIKVKVPVDEFVGVAVSTSITADGVLSSSIELVHGDPDLNYRVFEELGNANVVAEWQNWGRSSACRCSSRPVTATSSPIRSRSMASHLASSHDRRRLAADAERRPRFLNRRQTGQPSQD